MGYEGEWWLDALRLLRCGIACAPGGWAAWLPLIPIPASPTALKTWLAREAEKLKVNNKKRNVEVSSRNEVRVYAVLFLYE